MHALYPPSHPTMASSNATGWRAVQYHKIFARKDLHYRGREVKCNCSNAEYNLDKRAATKHQRSAPSGEENAVTTRTFVDTLGRVVHIPHTPQRLVSLVPSLTEVLCSFGRGAQVVGITD